MSIDGSSSRMAKSAAVVPAASDVRSVDHLLDLSESDSGAEGKTTGDEGQWLETNNPTQSRTKKRKQEQDPRNPAPKRASETNLLAECLANTHYNSRLDMVALQAARDDLAEKEITRSGPSPRLQQAKEAARARLAESVDDGNGWTELLIEEATPGDDPNQPLPSCTIGKLASLQQYIEKLSIRGTAWLEEKDERISRLESQLQEVRKETGQLNTPNEQAEQNEINELARANRKLTKDLESKQLDIDNRIRDFETTRKKLEAANSSLEIRKQDIQRVEAERDSERQARKMQFDVFKQMSNLPPSLQLAEDTQQLVIQCFNKNRPLELRCSVLAKDCVLFSALADGTITQWTEESPVGRLFWHELSPWFDIGMERGSLRYLELDENPLEIMKWMKDRYPMRKVTDDEVRKL